MPARIARSILLYRFLSFRKETAQLPLLEQERQIFLRNEMWFSSLADFNDPFEGRPHFIVNSIGEAELTSYFRRLVNSHESSKNLSAFDRARVVHANVKKILTDPTEFIQVKSEIFRQTPREVSVCCFAKSFRSLLMWSHYSAGHAGYCIGVRFNGLIEGELFPEQVSYRKKYPSIDILRDHEALGSLWETLEALLYTKSPSWRYEKEWRIVRPRVAGLQSMGSARIERVIFGTKMESSMKEATIALIKQSGDPPSMYIAEPMSDRFAIKLRPVK